MFAYNKTKLTEENFVSFIEPEVDLYGRLVNQSGLFIKAEPEKTIEGAILDKLTSSKEGGSIGNKELLISQAEYLCKIYIENSDENQKDCLESLKQMNIHYANLFPDLIGASEYCNMLIRFKNLENKEDLEIENQFHTTEDYYPHKENIEDNNTDNKHHKINSSFNHSITRIIRSNKPLNKVELDNIVEQLNLVYVKGKVLDFEKKESAKAKIKLGWRQILIRNRFNNIDQIVNKLSKLFKIN